jgi:TolA-binding protein
MTSKLKKIIFTIVALIIIFVVYAVFIKKDPSVDPLITGAERSGPSAQLLGTQISQALLRIEQIKLDKTIFNNELYRSLQDRSIPIEQEPKGRQNPFAPIGAISPVSAVRSTSTQSSTTTSATTTSSTSTVTSTTSTGPVTSPSN